MIVPTFKEMAGVADARTLNGTEPQSVRVCAQPDGVSIYHTGTKPALLTVEQARFIARKLYRMARIVELRNV